MANKDRLVEEASMLMARHGYASVTMDTVIEHTGIAKSNAYYHYPNKELLGLDVLQFWCDVFSKLDTITLAHDALTIPVRLSHFRDRLIQFQQDNNFVGDPISTISSQIGTTQANELYMMHSENHVASLSSFISSGQKAGAINRNLVPKSTAEFMHLTILGALSETRSTEDIAPLTHAFSCIYELLF